MASAVEFAPVAADDAPSEKSNPPDSNPSQSLAGERWRNATKRIQGESRPFRLPSVVDGEDGISDAYDDNTQRSPAQRKWLEKRGKRDQDLVTWAGISKPNRIGVVR